MRVLHFALPRLPGASIPLRAVQLLCRNPLLRTENQLSGDTHQMTDFR
jgi:hypothetical protein